MRKIILWGTGKIAKEILDNCQTLDCYNILGFIDNNREKIGDTFYGFEIYGVEILQTIQPDNIVILTDYYDEVLNQIKESYPLYEKIVEDKYFFVKQSILQRYNHNTDLEIIEILNYIKKNRLDFFNYDFKEKYNNFKFEVFYDNKYGLFYVVHNGKRLYFSKRYDSVEKVESYYRCLLIEQDEMSPHRYTSDDFVVNTGDVVIDVGAAEGIFSLEIIEKASKVYVVEMDDEWIEALNVTFKDYKDKVVIIKHCITSYDEGKFRRLDSIIAEEINFIKMDIEGYEWDALCGAVGIIEKSRNLKLAICCYHSDFDQALIESFMDTNNIKHYTTKGYIWFPSLIRQNYVSTSLHRGIVRGEKQWI